MKNSASILAPKASQSFIKLIDLFVNHKQFNVGPVSLIINALETASRKGAKTVLISSQVPEQASIDYHIPVAVVRHLNYGNRISPQLPLLMMIDVLYAYYLAIDKTKKENIFKDTIID